MSSYRVEFNQGGLPSGDRQSLPVPDLTTALVVADINLERGVAELHDGDKLVATIEKHGRGGRTYWEISAAA
ncbi:hypothetical protein [Aurantiacibacter luteus]|uniref:Uncharacterized protein n=1 Tax=Aurantiacibacter luteus TaxID=1581420 RepID=A0A0G9MSW4_9SPHN|nr:hypothetical protein [Aurantiacibacter luteus]KLE32413.1 hypothetical protein AAW00_13330 [Aurantiacibacter luteus]